jgi:uncharacterized protein
VGLPPRTYEVTVERDVEVPMRDGVVLLTDVYHPSGLDRSPAILERTAYGRAMANIGSTADEFASRGYRFLMQACRGTDGSGGSHSWFAEAPDGGDMAAWVDRQPWFDGNLGTLGASYMGYVQWALASTRPANLKAMSVALATTDRVFSWFTGGTLALEVLIPWNLMALGFGGGQPGIVLDSAERDAMAARMSNLHTTFDHLPLGEALRVTAGADLPLFQQQLAHNDPDDPFWAPLRLRHALADWHIPVLLIDGWQDYALPGMLADYRALDGADVPVWLRVGAGGHLGGGGESAGLEAPLEWFDRHLRDGSASGRERRVSVFVQGAGAHWEEIPDWPPPSMPTAWFLQPGGGFGPEEPPPSPPDVHRYDPADPTPTVGGIGMLTGGVVDNRSIEERPDVLVYTSEPLAEPFRILGKVDARIVLSTTNNYTDLFVRLCDVQPDGRSLNVCDGFRRYTPESIAADAEGRFEAVIALWPTAYTFGVGHRLRVQLSGGAHPVYGRNLGTGEPPATAIAMQPATHTIYHEPGRASRLLLPRDTGEHRS